MAEYIEREDAIKAIHDEWDEVCNYDGSGIEIENDMENVIDRVPAADVRPVVHARWLDGYRKQICSICCYKGVRSWRFCPQCGAQMDAEG